MNYLLKHVPEPTIVRRQAGVTLIELMVTLTISLIVLAGASVILVSANKSSRLQDGIVGLQENARFAVQRINEDIRLAGYYGCVEDINPADPQGPIISKLGVNIFLPAPVQGYDNTDATAMALTAPSKDVLEIQFAQPISELSSDMVSTLSPITVADASSLAVGDVAMIATCEVGDIFSVSNITASGSDDIIDHQTDTTSGETLANPNSTDSLSAWYPVQGYQYGNPTRLYEFSRVKYYVANDASNPPVPVLYRTVNRASGDVGGADEEFIRGVDAFEVLYGEDTDNDRKPDSFVGAGSVVNWGSVVAIKIGLLLRTDQEYGTDFDKDADQGDTISVLGTDFTADNSRVRRRLYQTTVFIRNTI